MTDSNNTLPHTVVPPVPFDVDALVRSIQAKIDRARASRDQVTATARTLAGIDVAEINP